MTNHVPLSSGVDALIARLREEGVTAGRDEAEAHRAAGQAALRAAMRDSVLEMKSTLMDRFSADVRRLVSRALHDEKLLRRMIVEIAGRARETAALAESADLEIVLPDSVADLEDLRSDPEELQKGVTTGFVLGLTGEMLREGVTFARSDEPSTGIRIHAKDGDITLDLTDGAVAALLLKHLQPRFRAILDGIVR